MEATTFALPATPRQIAYARSLALRNQTLLPWEIQQRSAQPERLDRRAGADETPLRARQPAVIQAGLLCRAPRPHQAPRCPG